jgi:hypothetical protein
MKMQDDKFFKTTDIGLAAFLLTDGIELSGINKDSSNRGTFLFPNTEKCLRLVSSFSQMEARVEPVKFQASIKQLKHLLYLGS